MCLYAIGAHNCGATGLKFGTELGFHPKSLFGYVCTGQTPPPRWGRRKSASGSLCSYLRKAQADRIIFHRLCPTIGPSDTFLSNRTDWLWTV